MSDIDREAVRRRYNQARDTGNGYALQDVLNDVPALLEAVAKLTEERDALRNDLAKTAEVRDQYKTQADAAVRVAQRYSGLGSGQPERDSIKSLAEIVVRLQERVERLERLPLVHHLGNSPLVLGQLQERVERLERVADAADRLGNGPLVLGQLQERVARLEWRADSTMPWPDRIGEPTRIGSSWNAPEEPTT